MVHPACDNHKRVYSGDVVWCSFCGCYADSKAKGMVDHFDGKPDKSPEGGGMWGQISNLYRRCHPETLRLMEEHCNADGTQWVPSG